MIIENAGIYAILTDYPPNNTFKEWRYLVEGTLCDDALVLPQRALPKPEFNPKTQKLVEVIAVEGTEVIQGWDIQDLTPEEIESRKRPNGRAFQLEMISDSELLTIYQKILANSSATVWLNEVRAALSVYTKGGFSTAINALAQSIPLSKEEIETVNQSLYKHDLELITWQP